MKSLAFLILGLTLSAAPAATKFLINEVHVNPPGTVNATDGDGNYEFIEIISVDSVTGQPIANQPCTGLTLLVIDASGGTAGEVNEAWSLNGLSTGANGILLLGDGYDGTPSGGPWFNYLSGQTAVGDPSGMGGDNLGDNPALDSGFSLLLVSNFTGIPDPGAGQSGTDVDSNDDRVLGPYIVNPQVSTTTTTTAPWSELVDSVGVPERRAGGALSRNAYGAANLNAGTPAAAASQWDVSSFARKRNANGSSNITTTAAAWYGGEIKGSLSAIAYNPAVTSPVRYFGLLNAGGANAPGEATPGQPNLITAPAEAIIRINEVSIDPAGSDKNYEYIELISTNRASASLSGYKVLLVDSSTVAGGKFVLDGNGVIISTIIPHSSVGEILESWSLDGLTTGTNSLCLIGNNYSAKFTPFGTYVSPQTILGSPDNLGNGDLGDEGAFTLLLVKDLPAAIIARVGNTPGTDLDSNDDGVIDAATFGSGGTTPMDIRDSIGYDQVITGAYATSAGKTYSASAKITMPALQIMDNLSRVAGTTTVSAVNWYGGQYGGRQGISLGFRTAPFFGTFVGSGTPGQPNFSTAPATATDIRLNEVHFGPTGSTGGVGYVEIASTTEKITTTNNLYLLVIDNSPPSVGTIDAVVDLRGTSTGLNGVGIFGDGAEETTFPWNTAIPPTTTRDDPQSFNTDGSENTVLNIGPSTFSPNNGRTVLLVTGFTGAKEDDLDTNDDGTYDTLPWTSIVDSISTGPTTHAGIANAGIQGYQIGNLSRYPGQLTANHLASWYYGQMSGAANDQAQTAYTSNYNGAFKSSASPGRPNHKAPVSTADVLINEVNVNPPGGDNNKEFIELISLTGTAQSLNGWSLLLIDSSTGTNNTGNVGNIVEAWSLDGWSTGANGLALLGEGYATGSIPYIAGLAPSPLTALADPLGLDAEDIGREGDNGAFSLLLVKDFTGSVADDLDTVGDYTSPPQATPPGDGVIDFSPLPWSTITDSIGIKFWNGTASRLEGIIYGSVDKSQTSYTSDNLSRQRGFLTPNSGTSWYGGDIVAGGNDTVYDGVQKFPVGFAGKVTPGKHNVGTNAWDSLDDDGDTVKNLIEDATNMNVNQSDVFKLPQTGILNVSGTNYPTFTYTQIKNTTDFQYVVETSTNLQTWTTGNTVQVSATDDLDGATTIIVVRPTNAYFAGLAGPAPKVFMRLRVTRL